MSDPPPWNLEWHEVDPSTHPFVADYEVRAALAKALRRTAGSLTIWDHYGPQYDVRASVREAVRTVLTDRFGLWASGWDMSIDDGGVTSWTLGALFPNGYQPSHTDEVVSAIIRALQDWRDFLERLGQFFAEVPSTAAPQAVATQWRAILQYVEDVTRVEDAWYGTSILTLRWYLQSLGIDPTTAKSISRTVHDSGFISWEGPEPDDANEAQQRLREAVEKLLSP